MKGKRDWVYDYGASINEEVKIGEDIYIVKDIEILEDEIISSRFTFFRNYILINIKDSSDIKIIRVRDKKNLPLFLKQE